MESKAISMLIAVIFFPAYAWSDSPVHVSEDDVTKPLLQGQIEVGVENEGADAIDERLPPVYPGEKVKDNGRTIKVWSTSGPVPVSQAPEPWIEKKRPSGIGVVVDQRE